MDTLFEGAARPVVVLVCGGRDYRDMDRVYEVLDGLGPVVQVVHGDCRGGTTDRRGADHWAEVWAADRGIPWAAYPARWEADGLAAGPRRNARMLREAKPDLVVAFPGGKGTRDMVKKASNAGLPIVYG